MLAFGYYFPSCPDVNREGKPAARSGAVRPPELSFLPSRATKCKSDYPSDPIVTLAHVGSSVGLLTIGAGGTSDRPFPADAEQACGPILQYHPDGCPLFTTFLSYMYGPGSTFALSTLQSHSLNLHNFHRRSYNFHAFFPS